MKKHKHVPPPVEFSRMLAVEWDIAAMQRYIAERGIPAQTAVISFKSMRGFFGDDWEWAEQPDGSKTLATTIHVGMFSVDKDRAMSDEIDPSIPIIIADITGQDGQSIGKTPIDGRHRMYKAWKTAAKDPVEIPFHYMSGPEELQFRTAQSWKPKKKRVRKAS